MAVTLASEGQSVPLCLLMCSSCPVCVQVMAMEAESEAVGELTAGDGLESKFAQLESGTVEDELAALKKGMIGGGKGNAGQLVAVQAMHTPVALSRPRHAV